MADVEVSFTPEYSNELLRCVQGLYEDDIKHYFTQSRLEKLLDLLEHTEYLFESYLHLLHENKNQDALTTFIIGCYYLYLIVPQSIEFQTRNKSYSIFYDLKKMYQNQANMTNVLLMVKAEVDAILDRNARDLREFERDKTRARAYSVPGRSLEVGLSSVDINSDSSPPVGGGQSANKSEQSHSDSTSLQNEEDLSPVWTAPPLDPNDQLKIALDATPLSPSIIALDQPMATKDFPMIASKNNFSRKASAVGPTPYPIEDLNLYDRNGSDHVDGNIQKNLWDSNVDRQTTHRKDSYHSVYMFEGEPDEHLPSIPEGLTQSLERLQKQSIITAPELYTILSSPEESKKLLLIDFRLSKRAKVNHIIAPNTVVIDPRQLWDPQTNTPISNAATLDQIINKPTFLDRGSFDYIVYYTDMKTYMTIDYDYMFTLFYLLTTSSTVNLRSLPTHLLGGYEKWKKIMKNYSVDHGVNMDNYIYRPYGDSSKRTNAVSNKKTPELPSWKPPAIPPRIRKRPPPPPRVSFPAPSEKPPEAPPPPVPPKVLLDRNLQGRPAANGRSIATPKPVEMMKRSVAAKPLTHPQYHDQNLRLERHYSIPTIENSSNTYVALSITGLRNLGNTCYINSMLQCLFATTKFRDLFVSGKFEEFFNLNYNNRPQLSKSFNILFRKMYINGGCSVVPTSFLKIMNHLRPDLRIPDDQQDTQEFLMVVLDRLHDELSNQAMVADEYPEMLLYDERRMDVNGKEYKKWFEESVIGNGLAPIDHIFQGQMENILECQRCGNSSFNYSTFYVLSLAIPKPSSSTFTRAKRVKLEDCINMFTNDEILSGENAWDCPKCGSAVTGTGVNHLKKSKKKKKTEFGEERRSKSGFFRLHSKSNRSKSPFRMLGNAKFPSPMEDWKFKDPSTKKSLNFISLPPVLIIHLSRFYYDLTKKNDTIVTYPLVLNIILKNNETVKYRLYAVVNHTGNLISGHYTSLVNKEPMHKLDKGRQKWYYFDDEVVKEETKHGDIDQGIVKVSSSDAYVLFYERLD